MFLTRYWRGDGSLARVFWLYGVITSTLAIALVAWAAATGRISERTLALYTLVLLAYTVWILVSVWRCAERRGDIDQYGVMARWLTVAWAANAVLVSGFVLLNLLA
jgi:hypothetical protein